VNPGAESGNDNWLRFNQTIVASFFASCVGGVNEPLNRVRPYGAGFTPAAMPGFGAFLWTGNQGGGDNIGKCNFQIVDVSAHGAAIDHGGTSVTLSGWYGSRANVGDCATARAVGFTFDGALVADTGLIGTCAATANSLVFSSVTVPMPSAAALGMAHSVRFWAVGACLTERDHAGAPNRNTGWCDNVGFTVTTP
jgi:hypothetical protein